MVSQRIKGYFLFSDPTKFAHLDSGIPRFHIQPACAALNDGSKVKDARKRDVALAGDAVYKFAWRYLIASV